MDGFNFSFWIQFSLLLFAILVMIVFFVASQMQKRRMEQKLDNVFFEVRELNLRVTIVETRFEERIPHFQISSSPPQISAKPPAKRGRPRKIQE